MRSRDGNSNLTLSICTLIFFNSLALNASEYLISYRYVIKDMIIYNEKLQISHTMTRCNGTPYNPLILENNNHLSLNEIINNNLKKFTDYIHFIGLDINYKSKSINSQNSSTTILTFKTTCFKVDFNDNFVKIVPLK